MTRTPRGLAAAALALTLGCLPGDRTFSTHAEYEAPRSALRISIDATGVVPAGADLSSRHETTVGLRRDGAEGALLLELGTEQQRVGYTLPNGARGSRSWRRAESVETLTELLDEAGFAGATREEVAEIVRVIDGAGLGPKATVMDGQTQTLSVIRISL